MTVPECCSTFLDYPLNGNKMSSLQLFISVRMIFTTVVWSCEYSVNQKC